MVSDKGICAVVLHTPPPHQTTTMLSTSRRRQSSYRPRMSPCPHDRRRRGTPRAMSLGCQDRRGSTGPAGNHEHERGLRRTEKRNVVGFCFLSCRDTGLSWPNPMYTHGDGIHHVGMGHSGGRRLVCCLFLFVSEHIPIQSCFIYRGVRIHTPSGLFCVYR